MIPEEKQILHDFLGHYKKFTDTLIQILDHVRDNGVWMEEDEERYTREIPTMFNNLKYHANKYKSLIKKSL